MKKYIILFALAPFLLSSCGKQNGLADGYGNFDAHAEVIVSAQNMGTLEKFNMEKGDHLQAGQLVAVVDTTALNLKKQVLFKQSEAVATQLKNVTATIALQEQQLKVNQTEQERVQRLFEKQAATQRQLDNINGLVEVNKKQIAVTQTQKENIYSQIRSIRAQVAEVNESISNCLIKNPVSGTVLVKYAEQGELATPGEALYKIANLKTLELNAYISGSELSKIKIGQPVDVYYDKSQTENYEVKGTVIWISSEAEFTPKTIQTKEERVNLVYAVKIKVPNENGAIKIGMPGEFRLINNNK
jgi:HlyD family secretion protein